MAPTSEVAMSRRVVEVQTKPSGAVALTPTGNIVVPYVKAP
jgi:hypothetical protein